MIFNNLLILVAMTCGLLLGWLELPGVTLVAEGTSNLFLRLLQLISLPIIFLAITATLSGVKDLREMRTLGRRVIGYTIGTTIAAASIALLLFLAVNPVGNLVQEGGAVTQQASYLSFLSNLVPANIVQAFLDNNVIGVAFLAMLFGVATLLLPETQKKLLHDLFSSLFAATLKITGFFVSLLPIAVFAFSLLLTQQMRHHALPEGLLTYLLTVLGANLVQGAIVLPLLLRSKGISPLRAFKALGPALLLAFFSKSSSATFPVALRATEERLGVSSKVARFSFPLCSIINMNGCAAFILITTLFVSMSQGVVFSPFALVGWVFLATLAAIGNAGVPMGCFFLTSAFLLGMNLSITQMGLILPFYAILDMIETALNIWSDSCVTLCVEKDLAPKSVQVTETQ